MVSLKELVMAELNPWRMKDITTIPINGPTISKNRWSARLLFSPDSTMWLTFRKQGRQERTPAGSLAA
jgi:hypothetical protein